MTRDKINYLITKGKFPEKTTTRNLIETHISWVIICDEYVYKIKRPIKYSFLDFSTLELRKHFCEREVELNQRMSKDIYLEVMPIYILNGIIAIGEPPGKIIEYAVKMRKLEGEKQMDILLSKNEVSENDIKKLAETIVEFHEKAIVIYDKDLTELQVEFNDLLSEKQFIEENLSSACGNIISHAVSVSDEFLNKNKALLIERLRSGFFRDVHGDLHTRNIFLLPRPQPFDCIEFNDEFRQIDLLNEVAFLCMDLDAAGRKDLSDLFIDHYNLLFPIIRTEEEIKLFIYYKSYRANIRAKVNSLRARSATDEIQKSNALSLSKKYLKLMESYVKVIS